MVDLKKPNARRAQQLTEAHQGKLLFTDYPAKLGRGRKWVMLLKFECIEVVYSTKERSDFYRVSLLEERKVRFIWIQDEKTFWDEFKVRSNES